MNVLQIVMKYIFLAVFVFTVEIHTAFQNKGKYDWLNTGDIVL
jgi:hypothetical protein